MSIEALLAVPSPSARLDTKSFCMQVWLVTDCEKALHLRVFHPARLSEKAVGRVNNCTKNVRQIGEKTGQTQLY